MAIIERDVYRLEGSNARGFEIGGKFAVLKGAKVHGVKKSLENAKASGYLIQRTKLEQKGKINKGVLVCDCLFTTPTQAGDVILGTTGGGPSKWINQDSGVSLKEERLMMQKSQRTKIHNISKAILAAVGIAAMFMCGGCGKQDRIEMAESNAKGGCNAICSVTGSLVSWKVQGGKEDLLYYEMVHENGYDYLEMKANPSLTRGMSPEEASEKYRSGWFLSQERDDSRIYTADFLDYAFNKRAAALIVARTGLTYQFGNYYHLDGVSGLIYNVAYLFSIPRKILTYWKCADGVTGYLWGVLMLVFGGLCSIVGCVLATLVNTLCHPIETLANLTVGVACFDNWLACVMRTNIIASLWDLIWGGMLYPLVKAVLFFM